MFVKVNVYHKPIKVDEIGKNINKLIVVGNDGQYLHTDEISRLISQAKKNGDAYIKDNLQCDDFNPQTGCNGHVYEYFQCDLRTCVHHKQMQDDVGICLANCRKAETEKPIGCQVSMANCPYKILIENNEKKGIE